MSSFGVNQRQTEFVFQGFKDEFDLKLDDTILEKLTFFSKSSQFNLEFWWEKCVKFRLKIQIKKTQIQPLFPAKWKLEMMKRSER